MAGKGGNRQQRQAAKAVRRRQAVAEKRRTEHAASSMPARIALAAASPVERCLRSADMVAAGIAHVVLAKRLPSGALGCGFFLVDLLCLGAKDAFFREVAPSELDERVAELAEDGQPMVAIEPASAKALILGAVAFASGCGMDPAGDYRRVVRLFDGIDAAAAADTFAYGRDGRAVYIPGPNDGSAKVREVERRLTRARGADGWDVELLAAFPEEQRITMQGVFELLRRRAADGAADATDDDGSLDIDHEGRVEARDG